MDMDYKKEFANVFGVISELRTNAINNLKLLGAKFPIKREDFANEHQYIDALQYEAIVKACNFIIARTLSKAQIINDRYRINGE